MRRRAIFIGAAVLVAATLSCTAKPADDANDADATPSTDSLSTRPEPGPSTTMQPPPPPRPLAYEWSRAPIGAGGFVTGITSARQDNGDDVIYARTDVGGAYRWEKGRGAWRQMLSASAMRGLRPGPGDYAVASVAAAPQDAEVVYLAVGADFNPADAAADLVGTGRVLRSGDGGETWSTSTQRWFVAGNQQFRIGTERLAVDPLNSQHVFFGTQREGLWRSRDGAVTWEQVLLDRLPAGTHDDGRGDQAGVNFVTFAPSAGGGHRLFAGVAHVGVFVSDDAGDTWDVLIELGDGDIPAGPAITDSAILIVINRPFGGAARLVRVDATRSTVEELTVPIGSPALHVAADPFDNEHLVLADHAVRDGHLWTSRDGGESWTVHDIEIESPQIPWLERTDADEFMATGRLMFDPSVVGRVWFAEGMGVWRSDDIDAPTVTWRSASVGIEETVVSSITVLPDGSPIATVADRQGFRLAADGSYPSRPLIDGRFASGSSLDYSAGDPDLVVWAGAESHIGSSPDRQARGAVSSDGGATWREMEGLNSEMFGGELAASATDPATLVWLPAHFDDPTALQTEPDRLYVTNDGGRTWDQRYVDGEVGSFHRLFWWFTRRALAADRVNGDFYLLSDTARLHVSNDGAQTWETAPYAPPCSVDVDCHVVGQLQAMPDAAGHLWASVGFGGLYHTADAGLSPWIRIEGIDEAQAFSFGAAMTPAGPPSIFVYGRAAGDDELALLRSDDLGEEWLLVARYPFDLANAVSTIAGDPTTPGRVYVGFAGSGVVVGQETVD